MEEIFNHPDLERLAGVVDILWAKNEPAPDEFVNEVKSDLFAVVAPNWRYGNLDGFPKLRAILDVGGGLPSPKTLDYRACFARSIRVLTCAPAFGPMVAEMALGMVLAVSREIVVDLDALTELVSQGRFKAVIDVFPAEPLPKDHPIRHAPGVVLSAHRAGSVERDLREIGRMVVDDLIAMRAGLPPTEMQAAQPELISHLP